MEDDFNPHGPPINRDRRNPLFRLTGLNGINHRHVTRQLSQETRTCAPPGHRAYGLTDSDAQAPADVGLGLPSDFGRKHPSEGPT